MELGVTEGEDTTVGGDQPVPLAVRGGRHPDDGSVEAVATEGPVGLGVAVGGNVAVGSYQPVPLAARCVGPAHRIRKSPHRRSVEQVLTEGEHATVGADGPVPLVRA